MLDCNRRDMELVSAVTSSSKTGAVMDLQQTGGLDCARFVVTSTAASAVLEIQGCDTPDGSRRSAHRGAPRKGTDRRSFRRDKEVR